MHDSLGRAADVAADAAAVTCTQTAETSGEYLWWHVDALLRSVCGVCVGMLWLFIHICSHANANANANTNTKTRTHALVYSKRFESVVYVCIN